LYDGFLPDRAVNGGTAPSFDTRELGEGGPYCLTALATYHWNNRAGAPQGGTITVIDEDGTTVGSWPVTVQLATENVPANWVTSVPTVPTPVVLDGLYTVFDSDPLTHSSSEASGGVGFLRVWVTDYLPPP
jgi:hypothetical protein